MGELRERDSVEHCRFGGGVVNRALERREDFRFGEFIRRARKMFSVGRSGR